MKFDLLKLIRISFNRILKRVLLLVDIMGLIKKPILLDIHKSCIHKSCIHFLMVNYNLKVKSCCYRMVMVGVLRCCFRMAVKGREDLMQGYMGKVWYNQINQGKFDMDQIL